MRARDRRRWGLMLRVVAISAAMGVAYSGVSGLVGGISVAISAVSGMLIGGSLAALEIFVLSGSTGQGLRRQPLALVLLLRTAAYVGIILVELAAISALIERVFGSPTVGESVSFLGTAIFSFVVSVSVNFAFTIRSMIGGSTLAALLTGRYHRPREEERMVLMIDLIDSTGIAQRIGSERFLTFLDRFVYAATEPFLEARGEIYRYVGDEIIVTWAAGPPRRLGQSIAAVFAIEDSIASRSAWWEREFGTVPRFRAALHFGPLIVGEIGDVKREITLLGDTMNTAARIETACRELEQPFLASSAALERVALPPGVRTDRLGPIALRGRSGQIALFAISRDAAPIAVSAGEARAAAIKAESI